MRRLGLLAIVTVGLLALLQAASSFGLLGSVVLSPGAPRQNLPLFVGIALLPFLASLALGVFLLLGRGSLSRRLFDDEPVDLPIDLFSIARLAFIILGLWVIIDTAPYLLASLFSLLAEAWAARVSGFGLQVALINVVPALIARALEVAVGILLVVRSTAFAGRVVGKPAPDSPTAARPLPSCPTCGEPYDPDDYRPGADHLCSNCGEPLDGDA